MKRRTCNFRLSVNPNKINSVNTVWFPSAIYRRWESQNYTAENKANTGWLSVGHTGSHQADLWWRYNFLYLHVFQVLNSNYLIGISCLSKACILSVYSEGAQGNKSHLFLQALLTLPPQILSLTSKAVICTLGTNSIVLVSPHLF